MDIITGKILKLNGWPDGKIIGIAKDIATQLSGQGFDRETILARLEAVRQNPGHYLVDDLLAGLARECIRITHKDETTDDELRQRPLEYPIWGRENIDDGALAQMDNATRLLKTLQDNAARQLGTSGTGNHFVEWGSFQLDQPLFNLAPGEYLALLSHSGSRSVGFKIADRYSKLAMEKHPDLDKSVRHLAWLSLDSEEGQEYWLSMELAGRFASANHFIIHQRVAQAAGLKEAAVVENHHNFAWSEKLPDGRTVIVHRKGATPAGAGVLGVIPGSMGDAGYLVRGRGVSSALESASHGAGRLMSRTAALKSISKSARDIYLKERGVTLLGGGLDESPQAYKPIEAIISAQADLVETLGKFTPRIVRMADEAGDV